MKKVELLSPAGDFECLKAAINNGADAVYIGGANFSARNSAKNFDLNEVEEAVKYAHLRNAKVYLAINTLLTDEELDNAFDLAKKYYELKVDALIIQDLGLYYRVKKELPDFDLHASTQMHIHNLQGVRNAKELGFSRVIVARESSLENIKKFCKENIEIECFIHGALCVSYSGQCLLSAFTKDRSANRGECAQCCRLKYHYKESDKIYNSQTEYLLSPKDMMLLKDIPNLIEAGVTSFKIEGRLKSPSYVAYVTKIYKNAIDAYYNDKSFNLSNTEMDNLKILFNRGYSNSYLINNNNELFNNIRPNNMGVEIGNVVSSANGITQIKLKKSLKLHDAIRILNSNEDYGTELFELYINNNRVESAKSGELISIKTNKTFNKNDLVLKTADLNLEKEILDYHKITRDIHINMICMPDTNFSIACNIDDYKFEYTNEYKPEKPINYPINKELLIKQFNKLNDHPYKIKTFNIDFKDCFINIKQINEIRRDFYSKLDDYLLNKFKRKVKIINYKLNEDYRALDEIKEVNITNSRYHDFVLNPLINTNSVYKDNNNIVSEFGGLLLEGNKIGFYTLNIFNSYAYEFILKLGFSNIILSVELNDDQIMKLIDSFSKRNYKKIIPYVLKSGPINLMNIYKNPFDKKFNYITDGKYTYKITRNNEYSTLSLPYENLMTHKSSNLYNFVNIK